MGSVNLADFGAWCWWWCARIAGAPRRLWGTAGLVLAAGAVATAFATSVLWILHDELRSTMSRVGALRQIAASSILSYPAQASQAAVADQMIVGTEEIPDLVEKVTQAQRLAGVTSQGIEYLQQPVAGGKWMRSGLSFSIVGSGPDVERCLLTILVSHPMVALDGLQVARDKNRPTVVEARIKLAVLVRGSEHERAAQGGK